MKYIVAIITWIDSFEVGSQCRKWVSILLKIMGVLTYIGTVLLTILFLFREVDATGRWTTFTAIIMAIGLILTLSISFFAGVVIAQLFWNRSNKIRSLHSESHNTLIHIVVILIRLIGEIGFLTYIVVGLQILVTTIFRSGIPPLVEIFKNDIQINTGYVFLTGVFTFVIFVLYGAFVIIACYFIAAIINLFVEMAANLKKIETNLSSEETTSDIETDTTSDS